MDGLESSHDWLRWAAERFETAERLASSSKLSSRSSTSSAASSRSTDDEREQTNDEQDDDEYLVPIFSNGYRTTAAHEKAVAHKLSCEETHLPCLQVNNDVGEDADEIVWQVQALAKTMQDLGDQAIQANQAAAAVFDSEKRALERYEALSKALAQAGRTVAFLSQRALEARARANEVKVHADRASDAFDAMLRSIQSEQALRVLGIS